MLYSRNAKEYFYFSEEYLYLYSNDIVKYKDILGIKDYEYKGKKHYITANVDHDVDMLVVRNNDYRIKSLSFVCNYAIFQFIKNWRLNDTLTVLNFDKVEFGAYIRVGKPPLEIDKEEIEKKLQYEIMKRQL